MRFKTLAMGMLCAALLSGCGARGVTTAATVDTGASSFGTVGPREGDTEWVVYVYMAADNNLAPFGLKDLNEMEAGLNHDKVKFVVMADFTKQGDSRIYEVQRDPNGFNNTLVSKEIDDKGAVIPPSKELNSGSPETLKKFVDWATHAYQTKNSMFVIWNHGGGAFADKGHLKSFAWDDASNSHLNLVDLWNVADQIKSKHFFDIAGFDTCLLGHLETAYQLKDLSKFLVSSEKTEPGDGWNYEAVAKALSANPGMSPRDFSAKLVEAYGEFYKNAYGVNTLSAIDLEKLGSTLMPAVDDLSVKLKADLPSAKAAMTADFKKAETLSATGLGEEDAIDLGLMGNLLSQNAGLNAATRASAANVAAKLKEATVANIVTGKSTGVYHGLKIYFNSKAYNPAYGDPAKQSFGTSEWGAFYKAYHGKA